MPLSLHLLGFAVFSNSCGCTKAEYLSFCRLGGFLLTNHFSLDHITLCTMLSGCPCHHWQNSILCCLCTSARVWTLWILYGLNCLFFQIIQYTDKGLMFRTLAVEVMDECEFSSKYVFKACTLSSVVTNVRVVALILVPCFAKRSLTRKSCLA